MKKEDCEKGQKILDKIKSVSNELSDMKDYKKTSTKFNISFNNKFADIDQVTFNTVMTIMISFKESELEKLQKEFDEL
jgi:hypothetical protein